MAEALQKLQPYIDVDKNKFVETVQEDVDEDLSDDESHDSDQGLKVMESDSVSQKKDLEAVAHQTDDGKSQRSRAWSQFSVVNTKYTI